VAPLGHVGRQHAAKACLSSVVWKRLFPAAAVRAELKETVKQLVGSGAWEGVDLLY
jgi:hypothetical protein